MLQDRFTYQDEGYKTYLLQRLALEKKLLDPDYQKEVQQPYILDRARVFFAVRPEIRHRLAAKKPVRLLEIGGGKGAGMLAVKHAFPKAKGLDITMTSLTALPEHPIVREQGIHIYTGVLAERLPNNWTERFDIICTDSVLGWTDISRSIAEIRRVLAIGGVWFGAEYKDGWMLDQRSTVREAMLKTMAELGMTNSMTRGGSSNYYLSHDRAFAVRYLKDVGGHPSRPI